MDQLRSHYCVRHHGTIVTECRREPGPTHHAFDVAAALIHILRPHQKVALLGFAMGGMCAPLRFLNDRVEVDGVDLTATGFQTFRKLAARWGARTRFHQNEASAWLKKKGT